MAGSSRSRSGANRLGDPKDKTWGTAGGEQGGTTVGFPTMGMGDEEASGPDSETGKLSNRVILGTGHWEDFLDIDLVIILEVSREELSREPDLYFPSREGFFDILTEAHAFPRGEMVLPFNLDKDDLIFRDSGERGSI